MANATASPVAAAHMTVLMGPLITRLSLPWICCGGCPAATVPVVAARAAAAHGIFNLMWHRLLRLALRGGVKATHASRPCHSCLDMPA